MSGGLQEFDANKQRRLITELQYVGHMVAKVVPNALHDAFGEDIFNVISCSDVSNQTKTELLNCTSQTKATISAAIQALNLFEKYLENPSQETARLLFCRTKSAYNEPLSPENVESPHCNFIAPAKMPTNKANEFENVYQEYPNDQQRKNDRCQFTKHVWLRKQYESLQIEHEETLFELGKFCVEEDAKRKKERESKIFSQIYRCSSSEANRSAVSTRNHRPNDDKICHPLSRLSLVKSEQCVTSVCSVNATNFRPGTRESWNGFSDPQATNQSTVHPRNTLLTAQPPASNQQHLIGATAMVKERKSRLEEEMSSNLLTSNCRKNEPGKFMETSELSSTRQHYDSSFSNKQDNSIMQSLSLSSTPSTSVAITPHNNYKLLLLTLAQRLLSSDVVMLKDWAAQNFSIVNPQNPTDVLFELDEKQVINASDLGRLCDFFESIIRFDLVYIIDAFLLGDYSSLRQNPASESRRMNSAQNSEHASTSRHVNSEPLSIHPAAIGVFQTSEYRNLVMKQEKSSGEQNSVNPQHQEASERIDAVEVQGLLRSSNQGSGILQVNHAGKNAPASTKPKNCPGEGNLVPLQTEQAVSRNSSEEVNSNVCNQCANEYSPTVHEDQNHNHNAARFGTNTTVDVDTAAQPHLTESLTNSAGNTQPSSSNISTPSTLQPSDTEQTVSYFQSSCASLNQELPREQNWLCSHYNRIGLVKFECCGKFWPCHRCHNNQRMCSHRKSHNAVMVRCVHCNTEQQFCQTCRSCGTKFANYYCELCKHLTGKDNFPYHCEKCGTCRIRGDRSFHCDVCGRCFDNEYRDYHIHDKCCICLEDAFEEYPILPCSHKFHPECVNVETGRRRFIRCNICRRKFGSNYLTRSL